MHREGNGGVPKQVSSYTRGRYPCIGPPMVKQRLQGAGASRRTARNKPSRLADGAGTRKAGSLKNGANTINRGRGARHREGLRPQLGGTGKGRARATQ